MANLLLCSQQKHSNPAHLDSGQCFPLCDLEVRQDLDLVVKNRIIIHMNMLRNSGFTGVFKASAEESVFKFCADLQPELPASLFPVLVYSRQELQKLKHKPPCCWISMKLVHSVSD